MKKVIANWAPTESRDANQVVINNFSDLFGKCVGFEEKVGGVRNRYLFVPFGTARGFTVNATGY